MLLFHETSYPQTVAKLLFYWKKHPSVTGRNCSNERFSTYSVSLAVLLVSNIHYGVIVQWKNAPYWWGRSWVRIPAIPYLMYALDRWSRLQSLCICAFALCLYAKQTVIFMTRTVHVHTHMWSTATAPPDSFLFDRSCIIDFSYSTLI